MTPISLSVYDINISASDGYQRVSTGLPFSMMVAMGSTRPHNRKCGMRIDWGGSQEYARTRINKLMGGEGRLHHVSSRAALPVGRQE